MLFKNQIYGYGNFSDAFALVLATLPTIKTANKRGKLFLGFRNLFESRSMALSVFY